MRVGTNSPMLLFATEGVTVQGIPVTGRALVLAGEAINCAIL